MTIAFEKHENDIPSTNIIYKVKMKENKLVIKTEKRCGKSIL